MATSVLELRANGVLCMSFKRRDLVSHSHSALLAVNLTGPQNQMLWELLSLVCAPQAGEPDVCLGPLVPQGETQWLGYPSY